MIDLEKGQSAGSLNSGGKARAPGVNAPLDGCVSATIFRNLTFRCDPAMHRVIVSSANGEILLEFGGYGSQPGAFDTPIDAVLVKPEFFGELLSQAVGGDDDIEPWIAVADYGNQRVQVFELNGALVGIIDVDALGDANGRPCGLRWRDPVLEVEGVDGARTRLHLSAALLQSEPPVPSSAFSVRVPRLFLEMN